MSQNWVCRPYRPGDEGGILDLYREVFHFQMSLELWRWMYQAPPGGPAVIVVLEREGRLVGHYAVQPREFWIAERRATVGFAVGTMVLPEVRSVTALVDLAQQAYVLCRERAFPWLYAFPNDQAHRVRCALLGWKALPEIIEWDGPLPQTDRAVADSIRIWQTMPDRLDWSAIFSESQQREMCQQNIEAGVDALGAARSADWMKWRFFDRPGSEYALHTLEEQGSVVAYAVTKRYSRDGVPYGHLLDCRTLSTAATRLPDLLASVWRQLAEWDAQRVSCWARGHRQLGSALDIAKLSVTGNKSNFCCFDCEGHNSLLATSPWQVEMADSDIY